MELPSRKYSLRPVGRQFSEGFKLELIWSFKVFNLEIIFHFFIYFNIELSFAFILILFTNIATFIVFLWLSYTYDYI